MFDSEVPHVSIVSVVTELQGLISFCQALQDGGAVEEQGSVFPVEMDFEGNGEDRED